MTPMIQQKDLLGLLSKMNGQSVAVVGDLILDRFIYGDADRISPESPVPVLNIKRENHMLGGAGNVVANLAGLGLKAQIFATLAEDGPGQILRGLLSNVGAGTDGLVNDAQGTGSAKLMRPTTIKTRFLAGKQQILRADEEWTTPISSATEAAILAQLDRLLPQQKAVILSDYGKGVLTPSLIKSVIEKATLIGIPVLVDPKGSDYTMYRGASVVTPNRKELALAAGGRVVKTDEEITEAAQAVLQQSGIEAMVATRSEDGMTIVQQKSAQQKQDPDKAGAIIFERPVHLRTQALEVFDVSGAGDTVIATLAAALAVGADLVSAASLANIAAGLVVAKVGTAPIRKTEFEARLQNDDVRVQTTPQGDLKTLDRTQAARICAGPEGLSEAQEQVQRWRARGLKVGFTNGCFDILHAGHVNYLNAARGRCDRLVLGLNTDQSVRILKGPARPVNNELDRATVIGALGSVDMVVFFGAAKEGEDNTASNLIQKLEPDIYFKGADYKIEQIPEAKFVQAYGGVVDLVPLTEGLSTSKTIDKIKIVKNSSG
jgi:D-beta-D-heptose 7-phosphate kinase/D-beta-D-heptose 1-phosphate adenosyltransferase